MYHSRIWLAIDKLAVRENMTCSGLAGRVGLDATLFNKSKRFTRDGKPHIPSFNTILKLVYGLGMTLSEFEDLMFSDDAVRPIPKNKQTTE